MPAEPDAAGWDGAAYRRVNSLQQWLAARAEERLDLDGVTSLLDVGCGDGMVTAAIAGRIPEGRVVGLDPSPRMLEVAPSGTGLEFVVGDVLTMPYEAEFDAVVSFNALHWVGDQRGALTRVAQAMRVPGRALLVFVCGGPRPSLEDVAMDVTRGPQWASRFAEYAAPYVHPMPQDWRALAEDCGLRVDELVVDDLSWDFGTAEAFRAWCTVGFGSWTDRLTPEEAAQFVAAVTDRYAEVAGSDHEFRFYQLTARLVG